MANSLWCERYDYAGWSEVYPACPVKPVFLFNRGKTYLFFLFNWGGNSDLSGEAIMIGSF